MGNFSMDDPVRARFGASEHVSFYKDAVEASKQFREDYKSRLRVVKCRRETSVLLDRRRRLVFDEVVLYADLLGRAQEVGEIDLPAAQRTPEQAHMPLLYAPYVPSLWEDFILRNRRILADQMEFLMAHVPRTSRLLS